MKMFKCLVIILILHQATSASVENGKRLHNHYVFLPSISQSDCFSRCNGEHKCRAATFDIGASNCFLYENFAESNQHGWISFFKDRNSNVQLINSGAKIESGIRLHNHYDGKSAVSQNECFNMCERENRCRASTYFGDNGGYCFFYEANYGQSRDNGWVSYFKVGKSEPSYQGGAGTRTESGTRLHNHYEFRPSVTQTDCFSSCHRDSKCRAATFDLSANNCFFYESFDQSRQDGWISFFKEGQRETTTTTLKPTTTTQRPTLTTQRPISTTQRPTTTTQRPTSTTQRPTTTTKRPTTTTQRPTTTTKTPTTTTQRPTTTTKRQTTTTQRAKSTQPTKISTKQLIQLTMSPEMASRIENGIRLYGYYEIKQGISQAECFVACQNTTRCKASTYDFKEKICYFSEKFDKKPFKGWNSYVKPQLKDDDKDFTPECGKIHKNTELSGKYYKSVSLTFAKCVSACEEDENCHALTFDGKKKKCNFFNNLFETVETKGFTSFIKDEYDSFGIHLNF